MTKEELMAINIRHERDQVIFRKVDRYILDPHNAFEDKAEVLCWFHAKVLRCDSCREDYDTDEDFVLAYIDVL